MSHCWQRGAEAILGDMSHIAMYEQVRRHLIPHLNMILSSNFLPHSDLRLWNSKQGGIAQVANIHTRTVANLPDGTFSIADLESKIRHESVHVPHSSLVCVENTHNVCFGSVLPLSFMDDVSCKATACGNHYILLHAQTHTNTGGPSIEQQQPESTPGRSSCLQCRRRTGSSCT